LGIAEHPLVFDLNTAPIEFLLTVPGMDYQQASRIVENRQARGGFRSINDLTALDDLSPEVLAELEKGLSAHQDPDR
jgi:DNA uptake protein ComE-like DNA-binding protein